MNEPDPNPGKIDAHHLRLLEALVFASTDPVPETVMADRMPEALRKKLNAGRVNAEKYLSPKSAMFQALVDLLQDKSAEAKETLLETLTPKRMVRLLLLFYACAQRAVRGCQRLSEAGG